MEKLNLKETKKVGLELCHMNVMLKLETSFTIDDKSYKLQHKLNTVIESILLQRKEKKD